MAVARLLKFVRNAFTGSRKKKASSQGPTSPSGLPRSETSESAQEKLDKVPRSVRVLAGRRLVTEAWQQASLSVHDILTLEGSLRTLGLSSEEIRQEVLPVLPRQTDGLAGRRVNRIAAMLERISS